MTSANLQRLLMLLNIPNHVVFVTLVLISLKKFTQYSVLLSREFSFKMGYNYPLAPGCARRKPVLVLSQTVHSATYLLSNSGEGSLSNRNPSLMLRSLCRPTPLHLPGVLVSSASWHPWYPVNLDALLASTLVSLCPSDADGQASLRSQRPWPLVIPIFAMRVFQRRLIRKWSWSPPFLYATGVVQG